MASRALQEWQERASVAFDELENVHHLVGAPRPGREVLIQELIHSYVVRLAARFQGYARDLHSETAYVIANGLNSTHRWLLVESFTNKCPLDRGNAHPNVIAEAFRRLGLEVWKKVDAVQVVSIARRNDLSALIAWRNAITHDDIDTKLARGALAPATIDLDICRRWRASLETFVNAMDTVSADHCEALGLTRPW